MNTLTHHKKSVRALAIHPTEYSFASASSGGNNIKKWKCPEGIFVNNFVGHEAIINTLSINSEGVLFSGGKLYFYHAGRLLTIISGQRYSHIMGLQDRFAFPTPQGYSATWFTRCRSGEPLRYSDSCACAYLFYVF